jgi:hypothetical protein
LSSVFRAALPLFFLEATMKKLLASLATCVAVIGAPAVIVQDAHATLAPEYSILAWVQALAE